MILFIMIIFNLNIKLILKRFVIEILFIKFTPLENVFEFQFEIFEPFNKSKIGNKNTKQQ